MAFSVSLFDMSCGELLGVSLEANTFYEHGCTHGWRL
jgi:hypothetical protein